MNRKNFILVIGIPSGLFVIFLGFFGLPFLSVPFSLTDVPSVVILTEKERYVVDEPIQITIKNVGNVPLVFGDSNYGIAIVDNANNEYNFDTEKVRTVLKPKEEHSIVFDNDLNVGNMKRYFISTNYSLTDSTMVYSANKIVETWFDLTKDPNFSTYQSHMVPSVKITTDKMQYKVGEPVSITVKNVGTIPVSFGDSQFGIFVSGGVCCGPAFAVVTSLSPGGHHTLVWDQYNWADERKPLKPGEYEAGVSYWHEELNGYTVITPFLIVE